jgi:hypothetical protein
MTAQLEPLHHSRVGGVVTKTIMPLLADVHVGKLAGVFTTSASEYTPLVGCGGDDDGPSLLHPPATRNQIETSASHAPIVNSGLDLMRRSSFRGDQKSRRSPWIASETTTEVGERSMVISSMN